jgi:hypothetical protein
MQKKSNKDKKRYLPNGKVLSHILLQNNPQNTLENFDNSSYFVSHLIIWGACLARLVDHWLLLVSIGFHLGIVARMARECEKVKPLWLFGEQNNVL